MIGEHQGTSLSDPNLAWLQQLVQSNNALTAQLKSLLLKPSALAFAALPASPTVGMLFTVIDSNTVTWGATIAGGGGNSVLAWFNGANWTVVGK